MLIQFALVLGVHVQPTGAVMAKLPLPPAGVYWAPLGESEYVQATDPPAWLTVKVWPATAMLLLRAAPVGLGATL
jgi:hypothetical protein